MFMNDAGFPDQTIGFQRSGHRCRICWIPEIFDHRKHPSRNTENVNNETSTILSQLHSYLGFTHPSSLGSCKDVTLDWSDVYEEYFLETSKEVRLIVVFSCNGILPSTTVRSFVYVDFPSM